MEPINPGNKPEVNNTIQRQIDTIRSVQDIKKIDVMDERKKDLMKSNKDVHDLDRLFAELDGLEWLQRQIARHS